MRKKIGFFIRSVRPEDAVYLILISLGSVIFASMFSPVPLLLSAKILAVMSLYSFYSFSINNLFDRTIDRQNPLKRNKNPFSRGMISYAEIISMNIFLFSAAAALAYLWFPEGFLLFLLFVLNSTFYSALFKRMPLMDMASHFAGFYFPFLFPAHILGLPSYLLFLSAITFFAISTIGELDNQQKDLKYDRRARLRSTTVVFGEDVCRKMYYASAFLIIASVAGASFYLGSPVPFVLLSLLFLNLGRKLKAGFLGEHYDRVFLACAALTVLLLFGYAGAA